MSKIQDSLLRLFVFFCFLLLMVWVSIVEDKTLYNFYWLYISFAIIGLTIGIIRFVLKYKISCRQLQQWLWGVLYSFLHSLVAILVCVIVVCMFLVANYYIPTNNPYYNKTATVISKYTGTSKVGRSHYAKFNFEDNKIGTQRFDGSAFYDQAKPGDTYTFTLQNGFFNIPVIKGKRKTALPPK